MYVGCKVVELITPRQAKSILSRAVGLIHVHLAFGVAVLVYKS